MRYYTPISPSTTPILKKTIPLMQNITIERTEHILYRDEGNIGNSNHGNPPIPVITNNKSVGYMIPRKMKNLMSSNFVKLHPS
ncbi:MAG: hypothetical protein QXO75_09840 [Nitrososphaerota archaeon]